MKRVKVLWGLIFVLILLQALTLSYFLSAKQEEPQAEHQAEEQAEKEYGKDGYAAQVGKEKIVVDELVQRLIKDYGETVLDDMINRRIVFSEADRLNLSISEEEIEREINHLRRDYSSEEEFYQALEEQIGINSDELEQEIRFYLLTEEMATKDIVISEESMLEYYEENLDAFYEPTRFYLHQIVVETEEEAFIVINEIEQGSSFEAVAAERSIDLITSPDGGDMGLVTSDDFFLPYDIIKVAEEIPLNQISSPIQTEDGYAVIKISHRVMGGQQSYEESKGKIRRELALQEIDGISVFLDRLRANIGIENYLFPPE
jgi:foldase protein PrsA